MSPTYASLCFYFMERDEIGKALYNLQMKTERTKQSYITSDDFLCSLGMQGMVRVWPKGESLPKAPSFGRCSACFVERRLQP